MQIEGRTMTPHASRYLQQVCKHWGHRFASTFDAERGRVDFGDGSAVDLAAHIDHLGLVVQCSPDAADMLKKIVEDHVQRFAHKEGTLDFHWTDLS